MADNILFSTGKVRIGSVGVVLTDNDNLHNVQDLEFSDAFQEAMVRTAGFISQYPLADAQYDGLVTVKGTTESFSEAILAAVTGITPVVAGGKRTWTGTLTATPQYRQIEFLGQTVDGKNLRINIPRGKIAAFAPKFARAAFQNMPFDVQSFPGPPTGIGGTVYAPFIIEEDV